MPASTSYRLSPELKRRLAERSRAEGIPETALVTRLLDQGLNALDHPGIVYRPGPTGWRAGLSGGPDVDEVIRAIRNCKAKGDKAIKAASENLGLDQRLVRIAVDYAAEHLDEIEARLTANLEAVERVQRLTEARKAVLA